MSLNQSQNGWSLIQVEISFIPGIPQIHFLGQADSSLKESVFRLKSAFRQSGYEFPRTHQVVVNLTPQHIKKISPGIELAVALGILKLTGQGPSWNPADFVIYGNLGLTGEVNFPDEGKPLSVPEPFQLLSGPGFEKYCAGFSLPHLKALQSPEWTEKEIAEDPIRPPFLMSKLTHHQAEIIKCLAVGEHHALLAGSQGSGKSAIFEVLPSFLRPPTESTIDFHKATFSKKLTWRPVARPHHTITPQSMVGGGVPPKPGDITRAHGGALLLDELMEFRPQTIEVLREALSSQEVTVSRGLQSATFAADFQLIGTTNLCPCGKWVPGKLQMCGYSSPRCRSTLQKLSGPMLDRLQGFFFFPERMEKWTVPSQKLFLQIEKSFELQKSQGRTGNRNFKEEDLVPEEAAVWTHKLESNSISSARRRQACVAWARTLADLDLSERIKPDHFEKAYGQTVVNYQNLLKWGAGSG